ncbi:MAG: DUF3500 domain-containing protein [Luteolibacter sp.]
MNAWHPSIGLCGLMLVSTPSTANAEVEGIIQFSTQSDPKGYSVSIEGSTGNHCFPPGPSIPVVVLVQDEKGNPLEAAKISCCYNENLPLNEVEEYAASLREEPRTDGRGIQLLDWEGIRSSKDSSNDGAKNLIGRITVVADGYPLQSVDLAKEFPGALATDSKWTPRVVVKLRKPSPVEAATALLASLSPDLREKASRTTDQNAGVALMDLDAVQAKQALDLVRSSLSDKGVDRLHDALGLGKVITATSESEQEVPYSNHHLTISGKPGDTGNWGWQLEGNHTVIGMSFSEGKATCEPMFLALTSTAMEEAKARTLANILADMGTSAAFTNLTPQDLFSDPQRPKQRLQEVGIAASQMTEAQKLILRNLINAYIERRRGDLAESEWEKIRAADFDHVRFGWAGGLKAGEDFYYRIQGPTFLIEATGGPGIGEGILTAWTGSSVENSRDLLTERLK